MQAPSPTRIRALPLTLLLLAALVASSCAVETPRNGRSVLSAGAGPGSTDGITGGDSFEQDGGEGEAGPDGSSPEGSAPNGQPLSGAGSRRSGAGGPAGPGATTAQGSPGGGEGGSATPGGGDGGGPIVVSVSMPLSGPFGVYYQPVYQSSFEVWQRDINDRGGINGRPIELKKIDDKGTSDGAIAACKEAQSNGSVLVVVAYGLRVEGDCLEQAGIPTVFGQLGDPNPAWKRVRVVDSPPNDAMALGTFVKTRLGGDRLKIGVIHTAEDVSAVLFAQNFVTQAEQLNMDVVATEKVNGQQASFTAELIRLRNAGAQIVVMLVLFEGIGIVRDAKAMRYEPVFTGATFTTDTTAAAARDLWSGIKALRGFATADTPAYAAYEAKARQYGAPLIDTSSMALYGWALVTQRILEAAGPTVTKETIEAGFPTIKGFDSGIWPVLSWEGRQIGSSAMYPVECCGPNYTWKSLGPPQERFE